MIYKIKPIFIEKLWGGDYYATLYQTHQKKIGEVILFSSHPDYDTQLLDLYQIRFLKDINSKLIHQLQSHFPITIKLIDAKEDLSIQVHPDDTYAKKHHQTLGKEEYWIILDAKTDSMISINHSIKRKEELEEIINNENLHQYMNNHSIKAYDTFYIPANTVHAIQKNTRLLEIAQASILNFRVDDYKRKDINGQYRELHIDEALEVIDITDQNVIKSFPKHLFTHQLVEVKEEITINLIKEICIMIILEGQGSLNHKKISEGQSFILYQEKTIQLDGSCKIIIIESSLV
jgi:mannose-6-phosphate isomerase